MAEEIERKRKVRGGHRGVVTKLTKEVDEICQRSGNQLNVELAAKLESIESSLIAKKKLLEKLDEEILERCKDEEIENEIESTSEVESLINRALSKIKACKSGKYGVPDTMSIAHEERRDLPTTPTRNNLPEASASPSVTNRSGMQFGIKLPKIALPKYNGNITKFHSFWQSFRCSVDENEGLSAVHKFNYLMSSLEGEAYKALEGFDLTEENYYHAVATLKNRFGKTQQIINAHMQELLKLNNLPNENVSQLRVIFDKINVHVRGLESLGISSERYGSLLIPVIMSRMPGEITIQVARIVEGNEWDIAQILDIIRKEIEVREFTKKLKADTPTRTKSEKTATPQATLKTFVAKGERSKRNIECFFCKGSHFATNCNEVKDVQKRRSILLESHRCFNCLRQGHIVNKCPSSAKCYQCRGRHNTSICPKLERNETEKQHQQPEKAIAMTSKEPVKVLLQTAQTFAFGKERSEKAEVNILFDSGSQKSYLADHLKTRLDLETLGVENVNLNTFGSESYVKKSCERVKVNLEVGGEVLSIMALSFPKLCSPVVTSVEVGRFPHLQGLKLANSYASSEQRIDIVLGLDHYYDIVQGDIRKGSNGPTAVSSKLGWLLSGPVSYNANDLEDAQEFENPSVLACPNVTSALVLDSIPPSSEIENETKEITESLNQFWKHENMGIAESQPKCDEVLKDQCDIRFEDGRYVVSLPWKNNISGSLPSNFEMCENRLESLILRLKSKPELLQQYDQIFREQLATNVIEKVPPSEMNAAGAHYLCHFGVVRNDRETTKLRIVFDCSAKSSKQSLSLNEPLEIGENSMPMLFDTLMRFRTHPIVLTADIEKAFLQIEIDEADREALRFLWYDDVSKPQPTVVCYRYRRLLFGLTCSPSLLGQTIRHHISQYETEHPKVVKILRSLYADDMSCGGESATEAIEIYKQAKDIMLKGSFNLRKWQSNDETVITEIRKLENEAISARVNHSNNKSKIAEDDESFSQFVIGNPSNGGTSTVLGVHWDSKSDKLFFDLCNLVSYAKSLPSTKRSVLKLAAKIFDPLGCPTAFTVNLKVFFQKLCIEKVPWDDPLEGPYKQRYDVLVSDMESLHGMNISRYLLQKGNSVKNVQLHGFSDASITAYSAVLYLRIEYEDGEIETRFLASKSKVCPIKSQTIPRLELLGAVLLSKLVHSVKNILKDEFKETTIDTFYWVDSLAALCWIRNCKPWSQYVRRRVDEILKVSDKEQWFHCPGSQNPADLPSRGKYKGLVTNILWWAGPSFLKSKREEWP